MPTKTRAPTPRHTSPSVPQAHDTRHPGPGCTQDAGDPTPTRSAPQDTPRTAANPPKADPADAGQPTPLALQALANGHPSGPIGWPSAVLAWPALASTLARVASWDGNPRDRGGWVTDALVRLANGLDRDTLSRADATAATLDRVPPTADPCQRMATVWDVSRLDPVAGGCDCPACDRLAPQGSPLRVALATVCDDM